MLTWDDLVDRQTGILNFTPELNAAIGATRLAVFGAGGNGAVLDVLARVGFRHFEIADFDVVEATNLNRLPLTPDYVGMPKVLAWQRYLETISPGCAVIPHQRRIGKHDSAWVRAVVQRADLVLAGISAADIEPNFLVAREAARAQRPMVIGPGTANCWVVSTFTHENGVGLEHIAGFGTEGLDAADVDYPAIFPRYARLVDFPGRRDRLEPGVAERVARGEIAPRSCRIFVGMVNSAIAWEVVKNTARRHSLPLLGTRITEFPVIQIFDPYRGLAYYFHLVERQIGLPDWRTGELRWEPFTG